MGEVSREAESNGDLPMIDVGGIPLSQLAKLDDTVLIRSLNRILGDIDKPENVVFAGFNASI